MSIADLENVNLDNADDLYHIAEAPGTTPCFLCGQRLGRVAVYWEGGERFEQRLLLHSDCAQKLGLRLVEDGHKARLIEKGRSLHVGVVPSLRPVEVPQLRFLGIARPGRRHSAKPAAAARRIAEHLAHQP